jgi:hypothetical protein
MAKTEAITSPPSPEGKVVRCVFRTGRNVFVYIGVAPAFLVENCSDSFTKRRIVQRNTQFTKISAFSQ